MVRAKTRSRTPSPKKKPRLSEQNDDEPNLLKDTPPAVPITVASSTSLPSTPASNKRVFSGESYGHSSTETTPVKINHAEQLTQALQNTLIASLIYNVWLGGAKVMWAQNRRMYLDYRPYRSKQFNLITVTLPLRSAVVWVETLEKPTIASSPYLTAPSFS